MSCIIVLKYIFSSLLTHMFKFINYTLRPLKKGNKISKLCEIVCKKIMNEMNMICVCWNYSANFICIAVKNYSLLQLLFFHFINYAFIFTH